jgi:hypothetical protein
VKMNLTSDNHWLVDPSVCIENYGYNSIKLNAPPQAAEVTVHFMGKTGAGGFRALNIGKGGWRYGFVALLKDSTRAYSAVGSANVENGANPDQSLSFSCPADCIKLWLVVSGAPQEHWRHAWDDDNSNDEHWPYQVQFKNTNLLGQITGIAPSRVMNGSSPLYPRIAAGVIHLTEKGDWRMTDLTGRRLVSGYGNSINVTGFSNGAYILNFSGKRLKVTLQ